MVTKKVTKKGRNKKPNAAATLVALRSKSGMTQLELAKAAKMSQSTLSRFERRGDHRLSTLRRYVEALGGTLEVSVTFSGKGRRVQLY